MQKCSIWNPETDNRTLPTRLPTMKGQQKKQNVQGEIGTLLAKNCKVEKIIRFLRGIRMFKEM